MHEHALMTGLMRQIKEIAAAEGAQRVGKVSVWLGALSHMSPGHFGEHFADAAAGSLAEAPSSNASPPTTFTIRARSMSS